MDPVVHRIAAWDGLGLVAREWPGNPALPPLFCLPGLVRTGLDFEVLQPTERRVVAVDYAGRGASGRARDPQRYAPEACVRDVLDIAAALHLHDSVVVGTSFGGLLALALAVARPGLVRAVVLNDVGPDIGAEGGDFVRRFVALDPALPDLAAAVAFLRERLPPLSLEGEAAWQRMAELTYAPGPDGRWHPLWDTRIAALLGAPVPDLWSLFGGLGDRPALLVWGEKSTILLAETVARMQARHAGLTVISVPDVGHAPTLAEPAVAAALHGFFERHA